MKSIYELLLESEQLRLETDDAGPQVGFAEEAEPYQMFRTSWNTGRAGLPDSAFWLTRFFTLLTMSILLMI